MRARPDGADDLLGLGRREDELHVLGRLLDDLQQRVEPLRGHHVRLVDDVDLVAALGRAVGRAFAQVTGIVDTAVAGRVDLDDVDRAGPAAGQRHARVARAARLGRRPRLAVEAAGQDPRTRRLAAPARAAEEVGVVDAARAQRLHERLGHVLLADDVGERLGSVAAVQGGAHHPNPSRDEGHRARRGSACGHRPGAVACRPPDVPSRGAHRRLVRHPLPVLPPRPAAPPARPRAVRARRARSRSSGTASSSTAPRPPVDDTPAVDRVAAKYGIPRDQMVAQHERMAADAAAVGLDFQWQRLRGGNSYDAHRLIHLARALGREDEVTERVMRAWYSEGEPIGDPETLVRLATEAGLARGCRPLTARRRRRTASTCAPTSRSPPRSASPPCRPSSSTSSTASPARSPSTSCSAPSARCGSSRAPSPSRSPRPAGAVAAAAAGSAARAPTPSTRRGGCRGAGCRLALTHDQRPPARRGSAAAGASRRRPGPGSRTPRVPGRAHLPLLHSCPGGVQRGTTTRGAGTDPRRADGIPEIVLPPTPTPPCRRSAADEPDR